MSAPKRRFDLGLIRQLLQAPHRFHFFQAVRLLELHFSRRPPPPDSLAGEAFGGRVRFHNSLSLSFPASELEAIQAQTVAVEEVAGPPVVEGEAGVDCGVVPIPTAQVGTTAEPELHEVRITPAFFSLLGAGGALPLHYSERIAERELYQRDRATRAFFDIFLNRSATLLYQAWKKYRLELQYEIDRQERYLPLLLSIAGLGLRSLRGRLASGEGAVFDEVIAHYAVATRQRPTSAAVLERVLSDYFQVAVRAEQFVGRWYAVPPPQRSQLGSVNVVLGRNALAGERVWQRDLCVRLWIGPLSRRQFEDFLPGGTCAIALAKLVTLLSGLCLEYEVKLILKAEEVRGIELSTHREDGRVGWDAFLCSRPETRDRSDANYDIHPDIVNENAATATLQ